MCLFVSATLPRTADLGRIASLPDLPLSFTLVSNPAIERQLLAGEAYFSLWGLERGGCYCGTVIGAGRQDEFQDERMARNLAKKAAKLRKQGWSEAKTEAWLDQKEQGPKRSSDHLSTHDEALEWLRLCRIVLEQGEVEHLGLLLHMYRHDVATESFELRFEELALEELDEASLRRFKKNVLYRIRP